MEIEWRRLRADQLRELAKEDAIVIVPVGSLEQHGPHLPVEIDSLLGETVALRASRLAAATEKVVVLPMLWTGLSEHHMSFGGTITLDFQTFFNMIRCVCESVVRHGFRRIVLLNGHGGNDNALRLCADELSPKLDVPIVQFTYWFAAEKAIAALLERQSNLWHACEAETSMCMALRPELVAEDRIRSAEGDHTPSVAELVGKGVYRWRSLASECSTGVYGYPSAASCEKGEKLLAAISCDLAEKICSKELWAQPWR
ncbi:creatininase family protein [Bradyrhizobium sp. SSUT112]|uniref:creatininase family protein n=1 Tax=Bradyrhizobium sp. SSUT112 TaxID=3040604 RepID=UPI00244C5404|nr:creatininase family protein [Bradyrhizobium sp. SSUT112]MDH2356518.1 creatininase family protein [Bradyrhizobium sp. SSUT112]